MDKRENKINRIVNVLKITIKFFAFILFLFILILVFLIYNHKTPYNHGNKMCESITSDYTAYIYNNKDELSYFATYVINNTVLLNNEKTLIANDENNDVFRIAYEKFDNVYVQKNMVSFESESEAYKVVLYYYLGEDENDLREPKEDVYQFNCMKLDEHFILTMYWYDDRYF